ncbi:uncharacterized protein FIBRA_00264 [Fibroporia radiculosa]|uniref:Aminotransferase class I/classII large domain-containing protein n=1 Tax=Fibroporia radiculosa TaxID=599839 RepID=J7RV97_9APHY|nr:uncharacterized protein FIBRA_00264 [Fibroporia radiculosa]CCL98270.1 predicted protein [Fibroporia radiculosa]
MASEKRQKAIDLSHHLSDLSRARGVSPLKGLAKYFGRPGVISLAGGLPNPAYFPFNNIGADVLVPDSFSLNTTGQDESSLSWFWKFFGRAGKERTTSISIPKFSETTEQVSLAVALQYGGIGLRQLQAFLNEFVEKVYQPAYSDFSILVHTGNTDGWSRVMQTLINPGESFLTEEWTYTSALATTNPHGMHAVPIPMDKDGMSSTDLRSILAGWDEKARGCKRPHVMYTVPVGQNPCGYTMSSIRKKEIYNICVEYDIIIVEDDPYYFMQQEDYVPKSERSSQSTGKYVNEADWLASLSPSYLKFDYQGRVIRLDTFSKYIAPGSRLGWHTCSPLFAERLERQGETSTQTPCGFGQSLVTQLLTTWKYDGYIRWLHGIAVQYKNRRDFFIDTFGDEFHLVPSTSNIGFWKDRQVFDAYAKSKKCVMAEKGELGTKLFSFVPPSAGMFIWLKVHFENCPGANASGAERPEIQLWVKIAEAGVVISPGWFFAADEENPPTDETEGHFRISFSYADFETLRKAVKIIANVMKEFFRVSD